MIQCQWLIRIISSHEFEHPIIIPTHTCSSRSVPQSSALLFVDRGSPNVRNVYDRFYGLLYVIMIVKKVKCKQRSTCFMWYLKARVWLQVKK